MNHSKLAMDGDPGTVFRRAEELLSMGLDIPVLTQLFLKLKQMGLPVEPVYTMEQAVAVLRQLKEGNVNA